MGTVIGWWVAMIAVVVALAAVTALVVGILVAGWRRLHHGWTEAQIADARLRGHEMAEWLAENADNGDG